MKKILFIAVSMLIASNAVAQYTYNGKKITEKTFNSLYEKFKDDFYTLNGKVYWSWNDRGYGKRLNKSSVTGDTGRIDGKVLNVIDKSSLLLISEDEPFALDNIDTSEIVDNAYINTFAICSGTYQYIALTGAKKTVRKYTLLEPVNKDIFKAYINSGELLYEFNSKTVSKPCPACAGNGWIRKEGPKNKLSASIRQNCTSCNGTGKISSEIGREKVPIQF